eukprot:5865027-Pleurochrysis_carterae.AAC.1
MKVAVYLKTIPPLSIHLRLSSPSLRSCPSLSRGQAFSAAAILSIGWADLGKHRKGSTDWAAGLWWHSDVQLLLCPLAVTLPAGNGVGAASPVSRAQGLTAQAAAASLRSGTDCAGRGNAAARSSATPSKHLNNTRSEERFREEEKGCKCAVSLPTLQSKKMPLTMVQRAVGELSSLAKHAPDAAGRRQKGSS